MRIFKHFLVLFLVIFCSSFSFSQEKFQVNKNFKTIKFDTYIKVHKTLKNQTANEIAANENIKWKQVKALMGFLKNFIG